MEIVSENRTQKNIVEAEVKVSVKELDAAAEAVYLRRRENYKIFGFPKGRAPRRIIEERYGRRIFYKEAVWITGRKAAEAVADSLKQKTFGGPDIRFGGKFGKRSAIFRITYVLKPETEITGYKGLKVEKSGETGGDAGIFDGDVDDMIAIKLAGMIESDIPEIAYEHRVTEMLREWKRRTKDRVTLREYLAYTGQTEEVFREGFRKPAEIQVRFRLALEKIAELEGITVTVAEISAYYHELAEMYRTDVERVRDVISPRRVEAHLIMLKAFDWVKAHADMTF